MKPPSPTIREADRAGFTPGPWHIKSGYLTGFKTHSGGAGIFAPARPQDDFFILQIAAIETNVPAREADANALLIAACPTMFEALAKIERLATPGQELDVGAAIDVICDVWNAARSALALAQPKADQGGE